MKLTAKEERDLIAAHAVTSLKGDLVDWWRAEVRLLDRQIEALRHYLALVTGRDDWHGIMDASADMRELVARRGVYVDIIARVEAGGARDRVEEIERQADVLRKAVRP